MFDRCLERVRLGREESERIRKALAIIAAARRPLVSIVIDTYNYAHFIEEAVESALNQNFAENDMEIVIVDDGSTDDTAERLKKYKDKVKYIYKENGGQASAFNVGFENAKGEIICLLDSDDYWHPDKLKSVVGEFEKSERVDVVSHYLDVVDGEGRITGVIPDPKLHGETVFEDRPLQSYLSGRWQISPPTSGITIKANCLRKILPIPHDFRTAADLYMLAVLPFHADEYALIKRSLGSYRIHENNFRRLDKIPSGVGRTSDTQTSRSSKVNPTPPTVGLATELIEMNRLASKYAERCAQGLGYDSRLLREKFDAMTIEQEILLYILQGKKFKALQKVLCFDDPVLRGRLGARTFKMVSNILAVLLPYSTYLWLRERYRRSLLFGVVHRLVRVPLRRDS